MRPYPLIALLLAFSLSSAHALTDLAGKPAAIADVVGKGKWTVFEVWASDCPYCPDAILYMKDFKARYPQADLYGISLDGDLGKEASYPAAKRFIQQQGIHFPTLVGSTLEIDNYLHRQGRDKLFGTPSLLIFNPKGELRGIESGAAIADDVIDFIKMEESSVKP
jgi:thiol-disulfide isomerase/thioredoxin